MGIIDFFRQKRITQTEYDNLITRYNEMYKVLYKFLGQGTFLDRDMKTDEYVKKGYEGNADVFSMAKKIATKFATPPGKLQVKRNNEWQDVESHEFLERIKAPNHFQTWFEFKMTWELFKLITGNSIVYAPKLDVGNNAGKLTPNGLLMMPTQLIEIESGKWPNPIGSYHFTIDQTERGIDPVDVWHERFPSLQYEAGRHFMGLSPLKAALQILNRQNAGYDRAAKMYNQVGPPYLVNDSSLQEQPTEEEKKQFEKNWKEKYGNNRNVNVPALTHAGVTLQKVGYESVKELGILESSQDGRRVLANVLQVAADLFNDSIGSTFNNRSEARKEMWTDRLMVDHQSFYQGITNQVLPGYAGKEIMRYVPDYSEIEELQVDKKVKVEWVSRMYQDGAINGDEYREAMDMEPVGDEHHQTYYVNMNKVPASTAMESDILEPSEDEDKAYRDMKLPNNNKPL